MTEQSETENICPLCNKWYSNDRHITLEFDGQKRTFHPGCALKVRKLVGAIFSPDENARQFSKEN